MMNNQRLEQAKHLAQQDYQVVISQDTLSDGSIVFIARSPELTGCKAQGATAQEATDNLLDARIDYIYFLLEDGLNVPAPNPNIHLESV